MHSRYALYIMHYTYHKYPYYINTYACTHSWCRVCKEMVPDTYAVEHSHLSGVNFSFLNVDNTKWTEEIRQFGVQGIPEVYTYISRRERELYNFMCFHHTSTIIIGPIAS